MCPFWCLYALMHIHSCYFHKIIQPVSGCARIWLLLVFFSPCADGFYVTWGVSEGVVMTPGQSLPPHGKQLGRLQSSDLKQVIQKVHNNMLNCLLWFQSRRHNFYNSFLLCVNWNHLCTPSLTFFYFKTFHLLSKLSHLIDWLIDWSHHLLSSGFPHVCFL